MKKNKVYTLRRKINGDLKTPVELFLKVRDRYREPLLFEISEKDSAENSRSFICFEPLSSIIIKADATILKSSERIEKRRIDKSLSDEITQFLQNFDCDQPDQRVFGYNSYEAVQLMEDIQLARAPDKTDIPLAVYSFYKNVIVLDHVNNELEIICNSFQEPDLNEQLKSIELLIAGGNVSEYGFSLKDLECSDCTDCDYLEMVKLAQSHCKQGNVFQLVVSRRFSRAFTGDEFNVYRQLRRINPSPYLFYFDYGNFKLFGSSPEAQLKVQGRKAELHPIAGTYRRTRNDADDLLAIAELKEDKKENAEHMMLVDLARNDLSRNCTQVNVDSLREIQVYSHVIHLVSKVSGILKNGSSAYRMFVDSFPAGTLSGAPKYKAMQLINACERSPRSYYGGAIGMIGLDGSLNQAILIRSFLSKNDVLYYRAGAGVVNSSVAENELKEVENKIAALRKALELANNLKKKNNFYENISH